MPRYIDINVLADIVFDKWQECDLLKDIIPAMRNAVMNASTDKLVERKTGKWINVFVDGLGYNGLEFECSECGKRSAGRTNFCAYCGAQMKK